MDRLEVQGATGASNWNRHGRLEVPGAIGTSNWNRHGQTGGTRSYRGFKLEQTRTDWRYQELSGLQTGTDTDRLEVPGATGASNWNRQGQTGGTRSYWGFELEQTRADWRYQELSGLQTGTDTDRLEVPGATGASNWNRQGQTGGTRSYWGFELEQTRADWRYLSGLQTGTDTDRLEVSGATGASNWNRHGQTGQIGTDTNRLEGPGATGTSNWNRHEQTGGSRSYRDFKLEQIRTDWKYQDLPLLQTGTDTNRLEEQGATRPSNWTKYGQTDWRYQELPGLQTGTNTDRLVVPGATGASNWNRHGQTGGSKSYRDFKLEQTQNGLEVQELPGLQTGTDRDRLEVHGATGASH